MNKINVDWIPPKYRRTLGYILGFGFVVGLSVYIFSIRHQAERLAVYGYPGIFLFSVLTSATVILPAPGLLIVFSMGVVLDPLWIAVAAGTGAALGELTGYLTGYTGRAIVENRPAYERLHAWMEHHKHLNSWLILILAFIPLPIIDLAGIAAGALRISVIRFLGWCWMGKILKMLVVAYLGAKSGSLLGL